MIWWAVPGLIGMSLLAAFGSYFLKLAAEQSLNPRVLLGVPQLYAGGGLYVLSALLNYALLKVLPYSVVVPVGALCYVWAILIARFRLGEDVGRKKAIGLALVVVGVVAVAIG